MRLVDANVLLYAVRRGAVHHDESRRWLDGALAGGDRVGFSCLVATAFLRLATSTVVFSDPLAPSEAVDQLGDWTTGTSAVWVHPSAAHLSQLGRMLTETGTGGSLVNDAHLAALAAEQRAEIVSYDNDFGRFPGIRWRTPGALLGRGSPRPT